jgi:hypothetical protein
MSIPFEKNIYPCSVILVAIGPKTKPQSASIMRIALSRVALNQNTTLPRHVALRLNVLTPSSALSSRVSQKPKIPFFHHLEKLGRSLPMCCLFQKAYLSQSHEQVLLSGIHLPIEN